jgi:TRAP-type C4-dicarboxylate transport system permease small subunit
MSESMKETIMKYLEVTAKTAGFGEPRSIAEIVGAIIGTFLSLLGVIFLCLIIYGGYLWMTSAGNEQKVMRAKEVLKQAIIGMIVIMSAYSITYFVFHSLHDATM